MGGYRVVEIFFSPQGEGFHMGSPAVFIRFAGCNLGGGYGNTRENDICTFCDTDFSTFEELDFSSIVGRVELEAGVPAREFPFMLVLTGGEPLLQVDEGFILRLHEEFPEATIHIETNGTTGLELQRILLQFPEWFWVTVSPKLGARLVWRLASEVKVVVPGVVDGPGWSWAELEGLHSTIDALEYWLVPQGTGEGSGVVPGIDAYLSCLERGWRLGVQGHKVWQLK